MYSGINVSSTRRTIRRKPPPKALHLNLQPVQPVLPVDLSFKGRLFGCCRVLIHCIRRVIFGVSDGYDDVFEEFDTQVVHYKPSNLDDLCRSTNFTREEIKQIYRGFKQECPAGVVDEERFKELYNQFFPLGDAGTYANYVFATLDQDEDGHVTFDQFIMSMSVLLRGNLDQKLRWIFNLYDINSGGYLSKSNIREMLQSLHQIIGPHARPPADEEITTSQALRLFNKFDLNQDGRITLPEFTEACEKDPLICRSLCLFDTSLK